jgi:superfamily I DNA and RNA helicase
MWAGRWLDTLAGSGKLSILGMKSKEVKMGGRQQALPLVLFGKEVLM